MYSQYSTIYRYYRAIIANFKKVFHRVTVSTPVRTLSIPDQHFFPEGFPKWGKRKYIVPLPPVAYWSMYYAQNTGNNKYREHKSQTNILIFSQFFFCGSLCLVA